jgi:hypothetical protein
MAGGVPLFYILADVFVMNILGMHHGGAIAKMFL